jgi:glucose-1-phosphate adenylyltransferase
MAERVLAMVLAGGEGTRLHPLTAVRSKPAVPFGGRYRIVDFVLSNLVNSQVLSIYLLVQYKSQSLIEHVRKAWVLAPILPRHFVTVVPPQMRQGPDWFQGTADAVGQNINLIEDAGPDLVLVFGADHVYRMDVRRMIDFHRAHAAHVTVAALPVPRASAAAFGVIECDNDRRVARFIEKPASPPAMPGDADRAYASMGNYLFDANVLIDVLRQAHARGEHDFGGDLLPRLVASHRTYAYDFARDEVPGTRPYEERAYWRDVGTLEAYFQANMDTLGMTPKLDLRNPRWPILSSSYQGPVASIGRATIEGSEIAAGTLVLDATIRNSIVRREVLVEEDVMIEDSIVMDYCTIRRGARIRRAIIDRYNVIGAGERVGYDAAADRARGHVSASGLVVLPTAAVDTNRFP